MRALAIASVQPAPASPPYQLRAVLRAHAMAASSTRCDVAIVGGGLGGLALAVGLRRKGWDAQVFEAAPALRTATSRLISLGANAFYSLEELHPEVVPRMKKTAAERQFVVICSRLSPTDKTKITRLPVAPNTWGFRWSEVQRVLSELLPAEAVHCNHRGISYTEHPDGVTVHFKDQPDVEARLLVAADGVRSAMRAAMIPTDPGPRFLGQMNWSAVSHNPGLVEVCQPGEAVAYGNHENFNDASLQWIAIPLPGDLLFWQVAHQCDHPCFTPAPTGPAADGTTQAATSRVNGLVGGGMGRPGSKARLAKLMEEAGFDLPLKVLQAMPESDIFERVVIDRVALDDLGAKMYSPGGGVVLLGDAAHAMHTGPGQGARTAFEDAHTLVRHLEAARSELAAAGWKIRNVTGQVEQGQRMPAADREVILSVCKAYDRDRRPRTCRIHRFAQESCGLPELRDAARPPDLTQTQYTERFVALLQWLNQYPENPVGDPSNAWWPPVPVEAD